MKVFTLPIALIGLVSSFVSFGLGCSKSPTAPSTVGIVSLQINGSLNPSTNVAQQYTAIAAYANGTQRDVTANAVWHYQAQASDAVMALTAGKFEPVDPGEYTLYAAYGSASAKLSIVAVFNGTFLITGTVTSAASGSPVGGARVLVTSGRMAGASTHTDADGRYVISFLIGAEELTVSADGFELQSRSANVSSTTILNFVLTSLDAADISGNWDITLSASPSCSDLLPPPARERHYNAMISQQGSQFILTLTGPSIYDQEHAANGIFKTPGVIIGQSVRFQFNGFDALSYYSPYFFDRLSATDTMGAVGPVTATLTGSEIRGTMNDSIDYWTIPAPVFSSPTVQCRASDHAVVLRRQ